MVYKDYRNLKKLVIKAVDDKISNADSIVGVDTLQRLYNKGYINWDLDNTCEIIEDTLVDMKNYIKSIVWNVVLFFAGIIVGVLVTEVILPLLTKH